MAHFSDLPNELVIEIWRHVLDPEAVENFALASKKIYALGSAFIQKHNELSARFSSINHCEYDAMNRPADTLRESLLNPRASLYVRRVSIDGWRLRFDEKYHLKIPRWYPEETMDLLRQAITKSPFIRPEQVTNMIDELERGDEDVVLALIAERLPNVKAFRLLRVQENELRLSDAIHYIAQSQDTETLSRLEEVLLGPEEDLRYADHVWVQVFSALPSVKSIQRIREQTSEEFGE